VLATFSAVASAGEPFDPARCKLEVEARLASDFREEAWRLEKNYYPGLLFDVRQGDPELLDKYLKQHGYFAAAMDPDDPKSSGLRTYSTEGDDQARKQMAAPANVSRIACHASYVSRTKLKSVWIISGAEPAFKVEFK
jgi:hypothetical protein